MQSHNSQIKTIQLENSQLLPQVTKLIQEGHTVTLPLRGFSMRPFLEDQRDKAVLSQPSRLQKGDVVLAELSSGNYVLHRIIKIEDTHITLRGDGNLSNEYCQTSDVRAKAIAFYRKNRLTPDYTTSPKWQLYSWIWGHLYPIRRYLLFIYRHLPFKQ